MKDNLTPAAKAIIAEYFKGIDYEPKMIAHKIMDAETEYWTHAGADHSDDERGAHVYYINLTIRFLFDLELEFRKQDKD